MQLIKKMPLVPAVFFCVNNRSEGGFFENMC